MPPTRATRRSTARRPTRPRPRALPARSSERAYAHANLGGGPDQVNDVGVTVFNGPGPNHIRLHAYSPSLGAANVQVVDGDIIKSPHGGKFGQALNVPDAPDLGGDAFMLTLFNATITKASKTVLARCKEKTFAFQNTTTYDDGTRDERSAHPAVQAEEVEQALFASAFRSSEKGRPSGRPFL